MNNRPYPVHLSIASATEIEQTARRLRATREEFLTTGIPALQATRPMIRESWLRCSTLQVSPLLRTAPVAITHEDQLRLLLEENRLLLRAAYPVMKRLSDFLDGYAVVLSDANGYLLKIMGNANIRRRLERIDFVPGGDWSEAAAGTNAPGTSLIEGHLIQLLGAEHYCEGWQDLTCTAAPIRHPLSDRIVGTLDVTGNYRLIRPFLSNFITTAALQVQQEIHTLLLSDHKGSTIARYSLPASQKLRIQAPRTSIDYIHDYAQHPLDTSATSTESSTHPLLQLQEQRIRNAEFLTTAVSAISASLDLDHTLEIVARQIAHLLHLDHVTVSLFEEDGETPPPYSWIKQQDERVRYQDDLALLLRECNIVSLIQERGEPIIIDDISSSAIFTTRHTSTMRSLLLLPLITARGMLGFILASRKRCYHWLVDDVLPALTLATHAATAIENALHFMTLQQYTHRIEVLNALSHLLNTLPDPSQHFEFVQKYIVELTDMDVGMMLFCEPQREHLTLAAHYGIFPTEAPDLSSPALRYLYDIVHQIITTGKPLTNCILAQNESSSLTLPDCCDAVAVPLTDGSAILGILFLGSLTHRKIKAQELALLTALGQQLGQVITNVQLRRSVDETEALREANQIKSRFVSAVSHDLQSPLTAIQASVECLLHSHQSHTPPVQEHLLQNIAAQTRMLDSLVGRLLDLSRIEAGALSLDPDWTELPAFFADIITKFEELHPGSQIELKLAKDVLTAYIDAERIGQVVWNLLENAQKYAASSSPINLEIRWWGNELLVDVADRGPGIPIEDQEKIFQHFYRLKREQKKRIQGSGLGLAICRGIIQMHGGRIWVEKRDGGGSIFRFSLPKHEPDLPDLTHLDTLELFEAHTKRK